MVVLHTRPLDLPPLARLNSPTFGRAKSPRQDRQLSFIGAAARKARGSFFKSVAFSFELQQHGSVH